MQYYDEYEYNIFNDYLLEIMTVCFVNVSANEFEFPDVHHCPLYYLNPADLVPVSVNAITKMMIMKDYERLEYF